MADVSGSAVVNKIKGGKWTVALFFTVSVAYTVGWMTFSSLLAYYKQLYGPQVLLAMNIAYFLPSIPLLIVSGMYDDWLAQKFGVPQIILARLLIGLTGCAAVCASFPFFKPSSRALLLAITLLGLLQAIAFSASYQMVARFANKNVVSLGLGCVSSGLVTLLLETALQTGTNPTRLQIIWLFELNAGVILVGLAASVSLVTRHWEAIEAWSVPTRDASGGLDEPLLSAGPNLVANHSVDMSTALSTMDASTQSWGRATQPQFYTNVVNPLDYHMDTQTDLQFGVAAERLCTRVSNDDLRRIMPGGDEYMPVGSVPSLSPFGEVMEREGLERGAAQQIITQMDRAESQGLQNGYAGTIIEEIEEADSPPALPGPSVFANHMGSHGGPSAGPTANHMGSHGGPSTDETAISMPGPSEENPQGSALADAVGAKLSTLAAVWHCVLALFLSGTYFVLIFPFFTYIPTSGVLGAQLPKVLFFVRLFTDVLGRMAPRSRHLAISSPEALLGLGCLLTASVPLFFWYIMKPPFLSDVLAVVYIALGWALGGYINTSCYTVAPRCVEGVHKAIANGHLALTYQVAHTFGLLLAVFVAYLLFGDITPTPAMIFPPPPSPPPPPPLAFLF